LSVCFALWLHSGACLGGRALLLWLDGLPGRYKGLALGLSLFLAAMAPWHLYGAAQHWMDRSGNGWWKQYKLSKGRVPDRLSYSAMLPCVLRNQIGLFLPVCLFLCLPAEGGDGGGGRWGVRSKGPPPLAWELCLHMLGLYACYEVVFYCGHRAMHWPCLYKYHKAHHQTYGSVGISGQYASLLDFSLMQFAPVLLGAALLNSHVAPVWLFSILGSLNSIHSHGGYASNAHSLARLRLSTNEWMDG